MTVVTFCGIRAAESPYITWKITLNLFISTQRGPKNLLWCRQNIMLYCH